MSSNVVWVFNWALLRKCLHSLSQGKEIPPPSPDDSLMFDTVSSNNNTYISNSTRVCDNSRNATSLQCEGVLGGSFDPSRSTSWTSGNATELVSFRDFDKSPQSFIHGTDTLKINSTSSTVDVQLGSAGNSLGVGLNSSALDNLFRSGSIPSRTWSFYQGWDNPQSSQTADGSLIFGGLDASKTTGNNITLPFAQDSPTCPSKHVVTISDIKMNFKNGSDISIIGGQRGTALKTCILPDFESVAQLPDDIWSRFLQVSGSTETGRSASPLSFWEMQVDADNAYDGDLTFTLYPDVEITVPNHQLVTHEYDYSESGQLFIVNDTNRLVHLYSLRDVNENDLPVLGNRFFSSAYMMTDNDERTFTIWKGQPSTVPNIVSIYQNASVYGGNDPSSDTPTSESPSTDVPPSKGLSARYKGAIIGGIIGALAFALLDYLSIRLRRAYKASRKQGEAATGQPQPMLDDHAYWKAYGKAELADDPERKPPQEIPLSTHQSDVLAPYEISDSNGPVEASSCDIPVKYPSDVAYELYVSPRQAGFPPQLEDDVRRPGTEKVGSGRVWIGGKTSSLA